MKLEVDWTRCDGHGMCAALVPDRIVLDEWGFAKLASAQVRSSDQSRVRRAIGVCPALALRLEGARS